MRGSPFQESLLVYSAPTNSRSESSLKPPVSGKAPRRTPNARATPLAGIPRPAESTRVTGHSNLGGKRASNPMWLSPTDRSFRRTQSPSGRQPKGWSRRDPREPWMPSEGETTEDIGTETEGLFGGSAPSAPRQIGRTLRRRQSGRDTGSGVPKFVWRSP